MEIKTQDSTSGFIVGSLRLQQTRDGTTMFIAHVGQERFEPDGAGGFNKLDNHYFDIVQYGKSAERTFSQFKPGDRFVAEGYVNDTKYTNREGAEVTGTEFVVKKIGHDTGRTRYVVDRTPRQAGPERDTAAAFVEQAIEQDTPDAEPAQVEQPVTAEETPQAERAAAKVKSRRSGKLATIPSSGVASSSTESIGSEVPF